VCLRKHQSIWSL